MIALRLDMLLNTLRRAFVVTLIFATLLAGATTWAKDPIANILKSDKSVPTSNEDDYLKPDEAFKFSADMKRPDAITLTWVIAEKYYLYRDRIKISTEDTALVQLGAPQFPPGQTKHDEYFGEQVVYHEVLEVVVPVARAADAKGEFKLKVSYQGCAEAGLCYNPMTKFATLSLPSTDQASTLDGKAVSGAGDQPFSAQDKLAAALQGDSLIYALLLFFLAGLGLSFTPCVLPMIPILSGIIVGQGASITRKRSFALAFTYVQGMALTYAAAGAIFVLAFKQAPQAFFQQPWIVISMCLLFIALSFAMFGAYTLQMPSFVQTRLTDVSNKQQSGTYIGTFIMGALSALVVTACVAPAIIAALSVISQSRQIFRGALALYATGIGMGVPLLLVGASAGTLLPKAGAWMDTVKQLFGVLFLGVAVYLLQPLIPGVITMFLWATLAIVSGFWLFSLTHGAKHASSVVRGFGLLILVYGIGLLIGALAGRTDPLQPLAGIGAGAASAEKSTAHALPFKRVKSIANLDSEVAAAKASGKTVMLDFYADWCVSCKEMEKYSFTDPRVVAALGNAVLLQADVTANDTDDQALLNHFGIFGPPSIMFFGTDGAERKSFRVVGYMKADQFHAHVTAAFSS
jgi:thioredoxin:protein disulfide reductase